MNKKNEQRKRKNSCKRKRVYASEILANIAIKFLDPDRTDKTLETYKCRHCPGWHIGHNDRIVYWNRIMGIK